MGNDRSYSAFYQNNVAKRVKNAISKHIKRVDLKGVVRINWESFFLMPKLNWNHKSLKKFNENVYLMYELR